MTAVAKEHPRVLVTGARGFVGRHVMRALESTWPEAVSIALERTPDLLDRAAVVRFVRASACTHVIHAAGGSGALAVPELFLVHAVATQHLLDGVIASGRVVRLVNVGSSAQYGAQDPASEPELEETHADRPLSTYAVSKTAQEQRVRAAAAAGHIEATYVRLFNSIGPAQRGAFLVPEAVAQLRDPDLPALCIGNQGAVRDFVDVRDAADAIVACARSPLARGERVNVCSGIGTAVGTLVRALASVAGRPPSFPIVDRAMAPPAIPYQRGSRRKLDALTRSRVPRPLEETLRDLWHEATSR